MPTNDELEAARAELMAVIPVSGKATRRVRNAAALEKLKHSQLMENASELLELTYKSLKEGLARNDAKCREQVLRMYGMIQDQSGVNVNVVQQNNQISTGGKKDRSIESILRRLEARELDARRISDVQDAEFEDIKDAG